MYLLQWCKYTWPTRGHTSYTGSAGREITVCWYWVWKAGEQVLAQSSSQKHQAKERKGIWFDREYYTGVFHLFFCIMIPFRIWWKPVTPKTIYTIDPHYLWILCLWTAFLLKCICNFQNQSILSALRVICRHAERWKLWDTWCVCFQLRLKKVTLCLPVSALML